MIEIRTDPTVRELRWFGLALMAFFGILGVVLRLRFGLDGVSRVLWITGGALGAFYYAAPPIRRPIFVAWSIVTFPLGWLLSQAVLVIVFAAVLTPIGLLRRLTGSDPMGRAFERERDSYWEPREGPSPQERYFKQY